MPHHLLITFLFTYLCSPLFLLAENLNDLIDGMSLNELEDRLEEVDTRLEVIARYSPRTGVGGIGFRTDTYADPNHEEWIQVTLEEVKEIEEIILAPVLRRGAEHGFQSDAFPEEFRVRLGIADDDEGQVVATFSKSDRLTPRLAPLVIPVPNVRAKWVRIETNQLAVWKRTNSYAISLSEIFIFDGAENVALRRPVTASENRQDVTAWQRPFLTDGATPYLMDVPRGEGTVASSSKPRSLPEKHFHFIIDLEEAKPISGLHLHAVEQSNTAPQSFAGDFGIPHHFRLEGAMSEDFSDPQMLLEVQFNSIFEKSPIMMWPFPEHTCRYVRLTVLDPFSAIERGLVRHRVGFAEIEVISKGANVAKDKQVTGNFILSHPDQTFSRYTDEKNLFGPIIPIRSWLGELAERHQLEFEQPLISAALKARYLRQKRMLWISAWLTLLLGASVAVILIYTKMLRTREATRIRERIAANLHDELGANLHAIGLLGDMARRLSDSPKELNETLERIRGVTERTGTAAMHCANMMEAEGISENLVEEMQRDASRILADLNHKISIQGEQKLLQLKRRTRIDLMLFYKECLINIIRHSGATDVTTELKASDQGISLVVEDNGNGYNGELSKALQRRARLLGAKSVMEKAASGGVRIRLNLTKRKI